MLGLTLKAALLAAALIQIGPSAAPVQPSAGAQPLADPAIAAALAQWRAVRDTSQLPFASYASFLLAHRGWPDEASIRRAAEQHAGEAAAADAVRYFRAFAPLSGAGQVAYARALLATGEPAAAAEQARQAWRGHGLTLTDESWVRQTFAGSLTPADQDARADMLLWANQTGAAARQLPYVSAEAQPALAARLALRTDTADAASLATGAAGALGNDAGYVADRATWLRDHGAWPTARAWLAQSRQLAAPPGDPEGYLEVLLSGARGAAADAQWQTAYDIARQVDGAYPAGTDVATRGYGERDKYTDVAWIGAQAARKLGRDADAARLFERYARATPTPTTRTRGLYWAARAADRAGQTGEAARLWAATAAFRETFYGQLANEHLGRPLAAPPPLPPQRVDALAKLAFGTREVVRAARLLGNLGLYEDQTAFVRQIAQDAKSDTDHLLAFDLARELNRPDLAVRVGRSALLNGLSDYSAAGFPTVPVPADIAGDWTIIHAIARQETEFNRSLVSHAGARGLMQLMPATAREQAARLGIGYDPAALTRDPDLSMRLGAGFYDRTQSTYASWPLAIAAYNAGPGNVNRWLRANGDPRTGAVDMVDWIEAIPLGETRSYVQRVLENAVVYDLMRPDRAVSRGPANLSWYLGRRPG